MFVYYYKYGYIVPNTVIVYCHCLAKMDFAKLFMIM